MTREEAIKEIKSWDFLEGKEIEAIKTLIPELAESEDERMLREIKRYIKEQGDKPTGLPNGTVAVSDMIAWLERQKELPTNEEMLRTLHTEYEKGVADTIAKYEQKEQKPTDNKAFEEWIDDWWKHNKVNNHDVIQFDEQGFKNFCCGIRNMYQQKPVEWDDYTNTNLDRAIQIIKKAKGKLQGYQSDDGIYECDKAIECLEHFLYRGLEIEKPTEWSEEDEKDAAHIIRILDDCYAYGRHDLSKTDHENLVNKLKSLCPQKLDASKLENFDPVDVLNRIKTEWPMAWDKVVPKQEWSKEDERIAYTILNLLCSQVTYVTGQGTTSGKQFPTYAKERDWFEKRFKSLCPQSHWKPSEEQMKALEIIVQYGDKESTHIKNLTSLYEQLKKLI